MKFVRKKTIRGRSYYYFECSFRTQRKLIRYSRYLGKNLPKDIFQRSQKYFKEISLLSEKNVDVETKKFFAPKSILSIEEAKFWYQSRHQEWFESDLELFQMFFTVLFILNSNRAEGSKVTRQDIEKFLERKKTPKKPLEIEVANSIHALQFAFSKEMKWNLKSIKKIHKLLFERIAPEIAGKFKRSNNTINNELTTEWSKVRQELSLLLKWFNKKRHKAYPPKLALKFHYQFESIHPFDDGNGRVGRLLLNAYLLEQGYMPVIFFSENHNSYMNSISKARNGRTKKLAHYFIKQLKKTRIGIEKYEKKGVIRGGSPLVGNWEIEHGKIRKW